ncbi:MAG TPA: hypothetical protein VFO52_02720 [Longimicrobiales bacterium]|nr:hypothetical protein [Longimicrobiales bacterium]
MVRKHIYRSLLAVSLLSAAGVSTAASQVLHVNDHWEECAIVIDPSLTQEAWHQFVGEVGVVMYFRPMSSARPLGRGNIEFSLVNSGTRIDDGDAAWNDTFSHPDSTHWLFEGDALKIPGLIFRMGVTDRIDAGIYFTKNPRSNYGFIGGQVQYGLLTEATAPVSAAGRVNVVRLFGPDDLTATVYGADLVVSKDVSFLSPYAGVSGYLSRGHERTSKVSLKDESVLGVQGVLGLSARISVVSLGAEINVAKVTGYSLKIGFAP